MYLEKKKLAPRSLTGWERGRHMLMGHWGDPPDLDWVVEELELLCRGGQASDTGTVGADCTIWPALRRIRSDSSRNRTSVRLR